MVQNPNARIYALDSLRSFAFVVLIWVHCALMFTGYGWHLKFDLVGPIDEFISFCRPWRMPLIFLVSGVALSYSLDRRSQVQFAKQCFSRLSLPLLFGLLILIPPVYFFESLQGGVSITLGDSYVKYYGELLRGEFRWLHLWYLGYLLVFCLGGALVWPLLEEYMKSIRHYQFSRGQFFIAIAILSIPIVLSESLLRPYFPVKRNFVSDVASVMVFLTFFFYGATVFRNQTFLESLAASKWVFLGLSCLAYALYLDDGRQSLALYAMNAWLWVLFFVGCFFSYFNKPFLVVQKFNGVVFPFYLIHQLVVLSVATLLSLLVSGWLLFFSTGVFATITSIIIVRYLLMPSRVISPWVGLPVAQRL